MPQEGAVPRWQIEIKGAEHYYPMFPTAFADPRLLVSRRPDGSFWLSSSDLDDVNSVEDLRPRAEELVDILNGLARLIWWGVPVSKPVRAEGADATGTTRKAILAVPELDVLVGGRSELQADLLDRSGRQFPGAFKASILSQLADPLVRTVLRSHGTARQPDWPNLYRVVEAIDHDLRPMSVVKLGWVAEAAFDAFTASANNAGASGHRARHLRPQRPPKRTMTLAEAEHLVFGILTRWLLRKASDT
jgi:hypothetical protein